MDNTKNIVTAKTDEKKNQLQKYAIWSNFIYFVAGLYSFLVSFILSQKRYKYSSIIFLMWGFLIITNGIISIYYHFNNPSWTDKPETLNSNVYKDTMKADMGISISNFIIAIIFLIYRFKVCYCTCGTFSKIPILYDSNFLFSILFLALSGVFFFLSDHSFKDSIKCKNAEDCFEENLDRYDVFHSNWHTFSGITSIFWLITLKNSFK